VKNSFLTLLMFALSGVAFCATLDVPLTCPTIQAAINGAQDGDVVLVAPGVYIENLDFIGKKIQVKGAQGPSKTKIDGNHAGCVVSFLNNETLDAIIEGFYITNGYAYSGAGICCNHASATIRNNIIADNYAYNSGGGISCYYSSNVIMHDNIVRDNVAEWSGGGFNVKFSQSEILRNTVYGNLAGKRGGGVRFASGSFCMENNVIFNNWARYGGGVTVGCDPSTMMNNLIYGNVASFYGGGIHATGLFPINSNNTVYGNKANVGGGGISFGYTATGEINNMILWSNTAPVGREIWLGETGKPSHMSIRYSDLKGGAPAVHAEPGCSLTFGPGVLNADPLFVNGAKGDLHLLHASPCRNAGDSAAPSLPIEDFEGDPRVVNNSVDIGADEHFTHLYYTGLAEPGGSVDLSILDDPFVSPVFLWVGSGVLQTPLVLGVGDFYLQFPLLTQINLGMVPANGALIIPSPIPPNFPAPWDLPLQGFTGARLTGFSGEVGF